MTENVLSARLMGVADMITPRSYVCDVGCDHGFLDIYLIKHGLITGAIASDVRPGPIMAARENVSRAGFSDVIKTVLSDGLKEVEVPDSHSTLVMAGMGGPLILKMIRESINKVRLFDEIIISPQSKVEEVRENFPDLGLITVKESMVYDAGKFYNIIKLVNKDIIKTEYNEATELIEKNAGASAGRICNRYGALLIRKSDPVLKKYLEWENNILRKNALSIKQAGNPEKYTKVLTDIEDNEITFKLMEVMYGYDHN
ncbi:MAG: class I SAM-dependent methyltransferase [Lachnospiraceae bacterium]|nr:class I SAM-dependent methyltransferase [Lachnospiraceae bacterium]